MSSSSRQASSINGHIRNGKFTNFAQTCNLLSQYVKEKGSLRDLNLEIDGKIENLEAIVRPSSCNSTAVDKQLDKGKAVLTTAENQSPVVDLVQEKAASSSKEVTKMEAKNAQLTMFYGGRILVFDDFPMEKVREVVALARKSSSQMSYGISSKVVVSPEKASMRHGISSNKVVVASNIASSSSTGLPPWPQQPHHSSWPNNLKISSNTCEDKSSVQYSHEAGASSSEANGSDLPIARRLTIHRFLAKRKDRAAARGPYQVQEQPSSSNNQKGDEHLELKL